MRERALAVEEAEVGRDSIGDLLTCVAEEPEVAGEIPVKPVQSVYDDRKDPYHGRERVDPAQRLSQPRARSGAGLTDCSVLHRPPLEDARSRTLGGSNA
jgi:hypothetical protein